MFHEVARCTKCAVNHLLILGKEKHVSQKTAPRLGRGHWVDAIFAALSQKVECPDGRGSILAKLRQFSGEGCAERHVAVIDFADV